MLRKDCYFLGAITKTRGFKGDLVFYLDVTDPSEYQDLESVFVDINGMLTPFFIESISLQNNQRAFVKLEGISTAEQAESLVKKELFLPLSSLPKLDETSFYDHEVIGFEVIDHQYGSIGILQQVIDLPSNPLLQIDYSGQEVLLPLTKRTIQQVDRKKNILLVQAPEGLIELYLKPDQNQED